MAAAVALAGDNGNDNAQPPPPPPLPPPLPAPKEHKLHLKKRAFKRSFPAPRRSASDKEKDKDKNEPSRFLGEGVSFKAKLIGILEVSEARGDRMCQEALADLKMAIRAAGEHKQRININIAIDGLRLRDEKTSDCLYHHPVHKISFIAQDMSDSRAFGYIFGSPDTGHRFFGIKTDKAASQVVIAMRDLFQVVFELKKKEIELAKQHIEQTQIKLGAGLFVDSTSKNGGGSIEHGTGKMRTIQEDAVKENGMGGASAKSSQQTSEVIADLMDLEFELNSIQQGIHQMERITPSDPFGPSSKEDPFGDSFTPSTAFPASKTPRQPPIAILPPPPSAKDPFNTPSSGQRTLRRGNRTFPTTAAPEASVAAAAPAATLVNNVSKTLPAQTPPVQQQEKHWFDRETESLFDEGELVTPPLPISSNIPSFPTIAPALVDQESQECAKSPPTQSPKGQEQKCETEIPEKPSKSQFDVFTELDPLGTGRVKPYIDRKDFFQELKNPPKKVLKDLVTEVPASEATAPLFHAIFDSGSSSKSVSDNGSRPSSKDVISSAEPTTAPNKSITTTTASTSTASKLTAIDIDPFKDTDPFDKTDPFAEDDFPQFSAFPPNGSSNDPFDTGFADFTMFGGHKKDLAESADLAASVANDVDLRRLSPLSHADMGTSAVPSQPVLHGPLRVSLPPEKPLSDVSVHFSPLPSSQSSGPRALSSPPGSKGKSRSKLSKQASLATGMVKLPSPKSSQRSSRLMKQMTVDSSMQPTRSSPTPPMPPTPSHADRKSPGSQGILESVTLRNRSVVTPSPPIVACFPEILDSDNARLSGSSAELAEIAPEPPPRPTTNIMPLKPPPLPPKRQQASSILKPPPRPPHGDDHPHYDYIENYETSSPTPLETDMKSPPIPVPARRPRIGDPDLGTAPQRPRRQYQSAAVIDEPDYLPPIPILPPPQKKSPAATELAKSLTSSKSRTPVMTTIASILQSSSSSSTTPAPDHTTQPITAASLNITLSQLTKTGLSDLAAALSVSPGHLSNMTLQDLTKCLAKLQAAENSTEDMKPDVGVLKRDKYDALRESLDEEPVDFSADFETNFDQPVSVPEKLEDVFQEIPFDKYAVFRELIVQQKEEESPSTSQPTEDKHSDEADEHKEESKVKKPSEDRYAALREISLEDKETDVPEQEELSRQQSGNTESPTLDGPPLREPQSIIESTIFEEDANALEAETEVTEETGLQLEEVSTKEEQSPEVGSISAKEELPIPQGPEEIARLPFPPKSEEIRASPDKKQDDTSEGWAKFDAGAFSVEKSTTEGQSEGGVSPWSSDGKEFSKPSSARPPEQKEREKSRRPAQWPEDDESEEGWDDRKPDDASWERPWRENGWSDGESFYDDIPHYRERTYYEERRGRRRRVSPWKRGQRSSRDPSPWEQEGKDEEENGNWGGPNKRWQERSGDDEEEEEDYDVPWKNRPRQRGSSWDEERHRRYGSRDGNVAEYEERRKRRTSPWSGGGCDGGGGSASGTGPPGGPSVTSASGGGGGGGGSGGSSICGGGGGGGLGTGIVSGSGDADRRSSWESGSWDEEDRFSQHEYNERRYRGEREDDYRWRREYEMEGRYGWGRGGPGPGPDEEYMWHEQTPRRKHRYYRDRSRESPWEDEYSEQGEEECPRYQTRKRNWPKRPNSASEMRRTMDKSASSDYKMRMMEKQQHSLPSMPRPDVPEKMPGYGFPERRYRDKSQSSRPRSREGYFGSDQEYDYWLAERPSRQERDMSYEQRSQTFHPRRPPRHKKPADWSCSQRSPFDDDFSMQAFEFVDTGKADVSDSQKKSPVLSSHSATPSGLPTPNESLPKTRDSPVLESEVKADTPDQHDSPTLEEQSKTPARASRGSSHRQSPFEDDFTPPESRNPSVRLVSSISSDVSDHRKSPFDSCRVESVVEENECESAFDPKNGKASDDVFLPPGCAMEPGHPTDFESGSLGGSVSEYPSKQLHECKRTEKRLNSNLWSSEDSTKTEKQYPAMKARMAMLFRADSSSSLRKSESINIFARESDPFDDEFFSTDVSSTLPRPKSEQGRTKEKSNAIDNNAIDPFNWTKAFDTFNFEEDK